MVYKSPPPYKPPVDDVVHSIKENINYNAALSDFEKEAMLELMVLIHALIIAEIDARESEGSGN